MDPVDIDISSEFFSDRFLPLLHRTIMNNVKIGSKGILNLIIALRIALTQESVTQDEYNLILSLLVKLNEFWKWRDSEHSFIDPEQKFNINDKHVELMRKQLSQVYTDKTRILFDQVRKKS